MQFRFSLSRSSGPAVFEHTIDVGTDSIHMKRKGKRMKPIIFNTIMVEAIIDGIKTATRKKFKMPEYITSQGNEFIGTSLTELIDLGYIKTPYSKGDILYIRETWNIDDDGSYRYKAGMEPEKAAMLKWKPSIHMPSDAARIFLKVTDVYLQRLQDITKRQAIAEGIREYTKDDSILKYVPDIKWWDSYHAKHRKEFTGDWWQDMPKDPRESFRYLYDSTLSKGDIGICDWKSNPYVWVIEFERIEKC